MLKTVDNLTWNFRIVKGCLIGSNLLTVTWPSSCSPVKTHQSLLETSDVLVGLARDWRRLRSGSGSGGGATDCGPFLDSQLGFLWCPMSRVMWSGNGDIIWFFCLITFNLIDTSPHILTQYWVSITVLPTSMVHFYGFVATCNRCRRRVIKVSV